MYDGAPSVAISTLVSCRCMRFWKTRSRNLQATAVLTGIWPTFASTARAQRPVPKQQTFALLLVKHHECSLATAPPQRAKLLKTRAFRIEVRVATAPFSAGAPALPNVVQVTVCQVASRLGPLISGSESSDRSRQARCALSGVHVADGQSPAGGRGHWQGRPCPGPGRV